jgi:hypothetical protein
MLELQRQVTSLKQDLRSARTKEAASAHLLDQQRRLGLDLCADLVAWAHSYASSVHTYASSDPLAKAQLAPEVMHHKVKSHDTARTLQVLLKRDAQDSLLRVASLAGSVQSLVDPRSLSVSASEDQEDRHNSPTLSPASSSLGGTMYAQALGGGGGRDSLLALSSRALQAGARRGLDFDVGSGGTGSVLLGGMGSDAVSEPRTLPRHSLAVAGMMQERLRSNLGVTIDLLVHVIAQGFIKRGAGPGDEGLSLRGTGRALRGGGLHGALAGSASPAPSSSMPSFSTAEAGGTSILAAREQLLHALSATAAACDEMCMLGTRGESLALHANATLFNVRVQSLVMRAWRRQTELQRVGISQALAHRVTLARRQVLRAWRRQALLSRWVLLHRVLVTWSLETTTSSQRPQAPRTRVRGVISLWMCEGWGTRGKALWREWAVRVVNVWLGRVRRGEKIVFRLGFVRSARVGLVALRWWRWEFLMRQMYTQAVMLAERMRRQRSFKSWAAVTRVGIAQAAAFHRIVARRLLRRKQLGMQSMQHNSHDQHALRNFDCLVLIQNLVTGHARRAQARSLASWSALLLYHARFRKSEQRAATTFHKLELRRIGTSMQVWARRVRTRRGATLLLRYHLRRIVAEVVETWRRSAVSASRARLLLDAHVRSRVVRMVKGWREMADTASRHQYVLLAFLLRCGTSLVERQWAKWRVYLALSQEQCQQVVCRLARGDRALQQLCLFCWEGYTHDKKLVLERAWLWWQQHRLIPLSRPPLSNRDERGLSTGSKPRTGIGNTLRPQPTQALQWLQSVRDTTCLPLSSALGRGERERAPRSLLSRAVAQWAVVALQRLKRQASMIIRFCDTTSRVRDSRDALPLAIAAHLSVHQSTAQSRPAAPLAVPRSPVSQAARARQLDLSASPQMAGQTGADLMSPGPDLKLGQYGFSALQTLASPIVAEDLEELSFLSDFLASRGAALAAFNPRDDSVKELDELDYEDDALLLHERYNTPHCAQRGRGAQEPLTLQQLQQLEAECAYLGDLVSEQDSILSSVSEQDSFGSQQQDEPGIPGADTSTGVPAAAHRVETSALQIPPVPHGRLLQSASAARRRSVSSRQTAALAHSQPLTDSPSTSVLSPRGKVSGRESKIVLLAKAFMIPSPPPSYSLSSGPTVTSKSDAGGARADAGRDTHRGRDAHDASEQQPRQLLPAMQRYPSPPPSLPLSLSVHDSQEERDFQRWLKSVKDSRR